MAQYRSEVYIPVQPDERTFEERQRHLWSDLDLRMEARRQEWEMEISRMRDEFFSLRPMEMSTGTNRMGTIERVDKMKTVYVTGKDGSPRFKVRFDVHEFQPNEISVQTQENHLIVKALHEEKTGTTTIKRQFSRQVDVPKNVDGKGLQASVTKDGILIIDGPVRAPDYEAVQDHNTSIGSITPSAFFANPSGIGPIITRPDGTRELRLEIEVGKNYKPEDISVKTVDAKIVIHARHEEKIGNRTSFSEFNKEYVLPDTVDPFTVNSYLLETGKLVIEAPLQPESPQHMANNGNNTARVVITVQRR